jgi:hypothetical protein
MRGRTVGTMAVIITIGVVSASRSVPACLAASRSLARIRMLPVNAGWSDVRSMIGMEMSVGAGFGSATKFWISECEKPWSTPGLFVVMTMGLMYVRRTLFCLKRSCSTANRALVAGGMRDEAKKTAKVLVLATCSASAPMASAAFRNISAG